jgi:Family of unknown function (DUF6226)
VIDHEVTRSQVEPPVFTRVTRATPRALNALPLIIGRIGLGDVDDAGVVVGVGDPTVIVTWFPICGCDACDGGSQEELDRLDQYLSHIVTGAFRRLRDGDREIVFLGQAAWDTTGDISSEEFDRLRDDPSGWQQLTGDSWLNVA